MAKPAAKKKTQGASRNTPAPAGKGAPGWVWLVTGFVIACFVIFLIHLKQGGGSIGKVLPAAPGSSAASGATVTAGAASGDDSEAEGGKDQHYDFYSLLPNQKMVPNKDAEDAATKAATAAAALAGKKQAAMAAADQAAASGTVAVQGAVPAEPSSHVQEPASESKPAVPVASIAHEPVTPVEPKEKAEPKEKPEAAVAKPAKGSFFLQAGSFKSESEADRRRASILLLGLPVKTQMVEKDAQNWFRVIVGPMDSKDSLESARNALQGSGIQTVPVKKG